MAFEFTFPERNFIVNLSFFQRNFVRALEDTEKGMFFFIKNVAFIRFIYMYAKHLLYVARHFSVFWFVLCLKTCRFG